MSVDPVSIGVKVALMGAQMALTASTKTEGPRLKNLDVPTADYGTPLEKFVGLRRLNSRPVVHAEKLRERKVESKTKGGKYAEYKYYGTWRIAIADNPIEAVTRVWADKRLIYQATDAGPVTPFLGLVEALNGNGIKITPGQNFRVYLGGEDQMPDPREEAWNEDRFGIGSTPAYRGESGIFFEELPVEKFGNRLPTLDVEAVTSPVPSYPGDRKPTAHGGPFTIAFAGSGWAAMAATAGGQIEWWDIANREAVGMSASPGFMVGLLPNVSIAPDGTAWQAGPMLPSGQVFVVMTPPMGIPVVSATTSASSSLSVTRHAGGQFYAAYAGDAGYLQFDTHITHTQSARDFCLDVDGSVAKLFHPLGSSNQFTIECAGGTFGVTGLAAARSGPGAAVICYSAAHGHYAVVSDGYFYAIDPADGSIITSTALVGTPVFAQETTARSTFWVFGDPSKEYSLEDGSLVRSVDPDNFPSPNLADGHRYDPLSNAIWAKASGELVAIDYLDRVTNDGVPLSYIVSLMADAVGAEDIDVSELDQVVRGYSWIPGPARDVIDPLLDLYDCTVASHDFGLVFAKRGRLAIASIAASDFVAGEGGKRWTATIAPDIDLPLRVQVNFADEGKDQQSNTVVSQRDAASADSKRVQAIDLTTWVSNPPEAQKLSDRRFRRAWNGRETIRVTLAREHCDLEPGDVANLGLDGVTHAGWLKKAVHAPDGTIDCEFERDALSLNLLGSAEGAPMDAREESTIIISGLSKGFVIDTPLVSDADSSAHPLLYYAAGDYGTGGSWLGAVAWEADGDEWMQWNAIDASAKAVWGYANGALPDALSTVWDRGSVLNVRMMGTVTSVTEAAIDADPSLNLALVGRPGAWELVNFATATLQGDGTVNLSGFKRGRRGTEWACGLHAAGDVVVMAASLQNDPVALDAVGIKHEFRVQTLGRDVTGAETIAIDPFTGATLKPYAPARLVWTYDGTNLTGTITRRTRLGGSWTDDGVVPLAENSEAYEVDVYNGATLKRTILVSGTNVFTYTAAMATADGITLPAKPTLRIYQMSDAVGRGYALAA